MPKFEFSDISDKLELVCQSLLYQADICTSPLLYQGKVLSFEGLSSDNFPIEITSNTNLSCYLILYLLFLDSIS